MSQRRKDSWTGSWLADKLVQHDKITLASTISSNRVKVQRTGGDEYEIATMSLLQVNELDILEILALEKGVSFITNIPSDAYYFGGALDLAESKGIVLGNFGDLLRAMKLEDPRTYVAPEVGFILRGLRQHNDVFNVIRLDDSRYQIERVGLAPVIVLALFDYDLSADSVRDGLENYGFCDVILAASSYGTITTLARDAANSAGVRVYKWAELLSALNVPWN
jgi:hypothetical protein